MAGDASGMRRGVRLAAALWLLALAGGAQAQMLRFSNHRVAEKPEYATFRIGSWYNTMEFSQSFGYRYIESSGSGTDFLFGNQKGTILKDGADFPLISTLRCRNYLLISDHADLEFAVSGSYSHYPLETQEDDLSLDLGEEGILGTLSTEVELSPVVKATLSEKALYRTDYVDTRGIKDTYGGTQYEYFQNTVGANVDWLITRDSNLGLSLSRADNIPRKDSYSSQESVAYSESAVYEWKVAKALMVGASAAFAQTEYPATNRAGSASQTYSVSSTLKPTDRSVVSLSVGYSIPTVESGSDTTNEAASEAVVGSASVKTELARNLSHSLTYTRSQSTGYEAAFELTDKYQYQLTWKKDTTSAALSSTYQDVDPSRSTVSGYSDWTSTLDVTYPLRHRINLVLTVSYSDRNNREEESSADADEEEQYDYQTLSAKIGTSVEVWKRNRSSLKFDTYVQHVERTSESANLQYSREIFSASFTFSHRF